MLPNPGQVFTNTDPLYSSDLNDMAENIEALSNGSGRADDSIDATPIDIDDTGLWEELGRNELLVSASSISVSSFAAKKFLRVVVFFQPVGGTISGRLRFNSDTGANYAVRVSDNSAADVASGSVNQIGGIDAGSASANPLVAVFDIVNIATKAKLLISQFRRAQLGAANGISHREFVGKWHNTSDPITTIQLGIQSGTGSLDAGSYVIVYGRN